MFKRFFLFVSPFFCLKLCKYKKGVAAFLWNLRLVGLKKYSKLVIFFNKSNLNKTSNKSFFINFCFRDKITNDVDANSFGLLAHYKIAHQMQNCRCKWQKMMKNIFCSYNTMRIPRLHFKNILSIKFWPMARLSQ